MTEHRSLAKAVPKKLNCTLPEKDPGAGFHRSMNTTKAFNPNNNRRSFPRRNNDKLLYKNSYNNSYEYQKSFTKQTPEEFINSKHCFNVLPEQYDKAKSRSVDEVVDWGCVSSISQFHVDKIECPICLYEPVAPRMDRCGHVYCLTCLKQYLYMGDDIKCRKCAICCHFICLKDVKRVKLKEMKLIEAGDIVKMHLVKKIGDSEFPVPILESEEVNSSVKIRKQNYAERLDEASQELVSLETQLEVSKTDNFSYQLVPFIEAAICDVKSEVKALQKKTDRIFDEKICSKVLNHYDEPMKFYQGDTSRDTFLYSLSWRILVKEYGEENLPSEIEAKVVDVQNLILDAAMRKRYKYMRHLPLGRPVVVVELDIQEPLVSDATLESFAVHLNKRAKEREINAQLDQELTVRKIQEENRIGNLPIGATLVAHAKLDDYNAVPTSDDFMPLSPSTTSSATPATASAAGDVRPVNCPISFAQMSKAGASSIVGKDRRVCLTKEAAPMPPRAYNPSGDLWPSLGDSASPNPAATTLTGPPSGRRKHRPRKTSGKKSSESSSNDEVSTTALSTALADQACIAD